MEQPSATATTLIDNDRVRVSRWDFAPAATTGWHRHEHDYVVVPLVDGSLRLVEAGGERLAELAVGAPYFREEGVEHEVVNANDYDFAFIEIELKNR